MAALEQRRLDLRVLRMGYQGEEARLRAAIRAKFPPIHLELRQDRDTGGNVTVGFGVTISLPIFDRSPGNIAILTVSREQLFDQYVARLHEARAEVADLLPAMRAADRQIAALRGSLTQLQALGRAYEAALAAHQIDVLTHYDHLGTVAARRGALIDLAGDRAELYVALETAAGGTLLGGGRAP